jgi:hypothetical protein
MGYEAHKIENRYRISLKDGSTEDFVAGAAEVNRNGDLVLSSVTFYQSTGVDTWMPTLGPPPRSVPFKWFSAGAWTEMTLLSPSEKRNYGDDDDIPF